MQLVHNKDELHSINIAYNIQYKKKTITNLKIWDVIKSILFAQETCCNTLFCSINNNCGEQGCRQQQLLLTKEHGAASAVGKKAWVLNKNSKSNKLLHSWAHEYGCFLCWKWGTKRKPQCTMLKKNNINRTMLRLIGQPSRYRVYLVYIWPVTYVQHKIKSRNT